MKRFHFLYILILAVAFSACKKDDEVQLTSLTIDMVDIVPSFTSADIRLLANTKATITELYLEYAPKASFENCEIVKMSQIDQSSNWYQVTLSNLTDSTKYYIRYRATNKCSSCNASNIDTLTTLIISRPIIGKVVISDTTYTTAICQVDSLQDGGAAVTQRGICYSTTPNPTTSNNKIERGGGTNAFTCSMSGLKDNTTYYVRVYATNIKGTSYSEEQSFTTKEYKIPTVTTTAASNISYTSATGGGNITDDGGRVVTECGICYSTSQEPTTSDSKITSDTRTGSYTCNLAGLKDGIIYYVRAYAINSIGTAYGDEISFMTTAYGVPVIETTLPSNILYTTATIGGNVTADGGQSVTARGVCYSTTSNPTIANSKVASGTGTGSFTCNLTGLTAGTKYYVRAYATNSIGTTYGDEVAFNTKAYTTPIVTTTSASSISYTTATTGGNVTSDGGQTVTARGVCYSTTSNPTISNSKVASGTGTGSFTCNLTGLTAGTKYYVRAYATNSKGTTYGTEKTFTTTAYSKPTVTTTSVTNIIYTTATTGGDVTADGGQTVTARGVCYSTSSNPTISNSKKVSGSGTGSFTCNLTGLTEGTTYFVRAYATNSKGTAYGNEVTFTTYASSTTSTITYTASAKLTETTYSYTRGLYTNAFNVSIASHTFSNGTGTIIFNGTVTSIGNYAFYFCSDLTSVTIPNSVTSIGDWAFYKCSGLTSVTIPNSVASIGNAAFYGCTGLTKVQISDLAAWCNIAFSDSESNPLNNAHHLYLNGSLLTNLTIPSTITDIKLYAFYNCTGLSSVTIPNSVTSIGSFAFAYCSGLTSVTIPNSVTSIGYSFFACSSLSTINVASGNRYYSSFNGVLFDYNKTELIQYPAGKTGSYSIPNGVISIKPYAFAGCSGLTSVTLPPNSVWSIEIRTRAFEDCTGLTSITCNATNPSNCYYDAFYGVSKSIPVYVPAASVSAYKAATGWKDFTNIQSL